MKMMILIATASTVAAWLPRTALAQPCDNPDWPTWGESYDGSSINPEMDVVLSSYTDDALCQAALGASCSNLKDIKWTVRAALTEYWSNGGSPFIPRYKGIVCPSPNDPDCVNSTCTAPNDPDCVLDQDYVFEKLHISPQGYCSGGTLALTEFSGISSRTRNIRLCQQNDLGFLKWNTLEVDGKVGVGLQNVLLHELGHAVGMAHIEDCHSGTIPESVMGGNFSVGSDSGHLYAPEMEYLGNAYGYGVPMDIYRHGTADGLSFDSNLIWFGYLRNRVVANTGIGFFPYAFAYARGSGAAQYIEVAELDSSGASVVSNNIGADTIYHPGIALKALSLSNHLIQVVYLGDYIDDTGEQTVKLKEYDGSSWTTSTLANAPQLTSNGIYNAWDPESEEFLYVWQGDDNYTNQVMYKVGSGPVMELLHASGDPWIAADTPSIACGDASVAGTYNCLMVWPEGESWTRPVRWMQFYVSGSQIITTSIHTHPYFSTGSAVVSYLGNITYPWMIALNQDGNTTFTWRKGPTDSSGFVDQRSVTHSPRTTVPALGSALPSLVSNYRTILFLGDGQ